MALLTLQDLSINLSDHKLFDKANINIHKGERVALIGRNGTGKSTLLKLIAKQINPDEGVITTAPGIKIAYLNQSNLENLDQLPNQKNQTIFELVAQGLGELGNLHTKYQELLNIIEQDPSTENLALLSQYQQKIDESDSWDISQQIDSIINKIKLNPQALISSLSGGERRKALIAQAFASNPDLILLDEPTNHLDLESIIWLEKFILDYSQNNSKSFIIITHDRKFMQNTATAILDIDYGKVRRWSGNYQTYLKQKDEALNAQKLEEARFDKKLKEEEVWIRQGIKARRTRNEGRVRALQKMRQQRVERRQDIGQVNLSANAQKKSGKIIFELENLSYSYTKDNKQTTIFKDLTTQIINGDKIGLIGPNGSGKSTLIKCILSQLNPSAGSVKTGSKIQVAYFDQQRDQIDDTKTVAENISPGSNTVTIDGKEVHIISYLKNFLFSPQRARSLAKVLSGGERNRLLLARIFCQPNNVLILDEPTNDLDCETLDLLEELILNYEGTVLLVSHDREFLNNVVTSLWIINPTSHRVQEYIGGYDDYLTYTNNNKTNNNKTNNQTNKTKPPKPNHTPNQPLNHAQRKELAKLPQIIDKLEQNQQNITNQLNQHNLYKTDLNKFNQLKLELDNIEQELELKYKLWEDLENS